jgi:Bifunctional DNA primase/polymerase, N-terminal
MILHPNVERLALLGWRLHPASQFGRAACIKQAADHATCDRDQLARWTIEFPGCNWCVVMEGSGIWALDVDVPSPDHSADGIKALAELVAAHGPLPPRPTTRSGGGGLCLFFSHHHCEKIIGATGTPARGLDPRRGRLSVTVPPSIHIRTHKPYRWIAPPWEITPPSAPPWLLQLVAPPAEPPLPTQPCVAHSGLPGRAYAIGALRRSVEQVATAQQGQRNDTLNRCAWSMSRFIAGGLLSAAEIAAALAHAGLVAGLHRLEVERTLASGLKAGVRR